MAIRRFSKLIADLKRKASLRKEKEQRKTRRRMELQSLEDRHLMALYPLEIDPQPGNPLSETGNNVLNVAPTEIKFDFEAFGAIKLAATSVTPQTQTAELSKSILISRAGPNGTLNDLDDIAIKPGFLGVGDRPWEVLMRFNESLPDDLYQITIVGADDTQKGLVALQNTQGIKFPQVVTTTTATNVTYRMNLELGAKVLAVVPQPVTRVAAASGSWLTQAQDQVVVYFEPGSEPLGPSAQDKTFYQFFATRNSLDPNDQVQIPATNITSVTYNSTTNAATITFNDSLTNILRTLVPADGSADPSRAIRLRIGTAEAPRAIVPVQTLQDPDTMLLTAAQNPTNIGPGWSFNTAFNVGELSESAGSGQSRVFSQSISPQFYTLPFPGGNLEPGHRSVPVESHLEGGDVPGVDVPDSAADTTGGVVTQYYNFRNEIGEISGGFTGTQRAFNVITDEQKQLAREIFDLYTRYSGIQFIERVNPTPLDDLTPGAEELNDIIVGTGDLAVMGGSSVPGGVIGLAGTATIGARNGLLSLRLALMDNAESWSNLSGDAPFENGGPQQSWYVTAMHEIGHQLGLGHTYDLPGRTVMGEDLALNVATPESAFPGAADIVHLQHIYRPDSKDIDMYKIDITRNGTLNIETMAERLHNASSLDTYITVWREKTVNDVDPATGQTVTIGGIAQTKKVRELVGTNDDYFSKDSYLQLRVDSPDEFGTYYVGVTAKGNDRYDPHIADSGIGGKTEGAYELRLDFQQDVVAGGSIRDTAGTLIDGDGDGRSGGVHNFWFRTAQPMEAGTRGADNFARTIFVEKSSTRAAANGSLETPFRDIDDALAVARPYDIIRIIGNPGADNLAGTLSDNLAYQIGFKSAAEGGGVLPDGDVLNVPKDVTVMIDAGAIFQLRQGSINIGSNSATTGADRSGGALQVLGTPAQRVYFTSYNEEKSLGPTIGLDQNTTVSEPKPADWGGISFRQDVDKSDGRFTFDSRGIFLDYVNFADMRFGGGQVVVEGTTQVVTPVRMISSRPTVTNNLITVSADSAMSANPDSFEETNFRAPRFTKFETQRLNPDYSRVGPEIRGNIFVRRETTGTAPNQVTKVFTNSTNGLFIRSSTPSGGSLEKLTVTGRMDDIDIVHVVAENVVIAGTPGGVQFETLAPPVQLTTARIITNSAGRFTGTQTFEYRITFVDIFGNESPASDPISRTVFGATLTPASGRAVRLSTLPSTPSGYVGRRIYRRDVNAGPTFNLVGIVPATVTEFNDLNIPDVGLQQQLLDSTRDDLNRPRPDGALIVDPRVIMKLEGSRIELEQGSTMIAEGVDGVEVIFTSLSDDRWGAGGTFDTRGDDTRPDPITGVPNPIQASPGNWAGIEARQDSLLSIDQAVMAYGGGLNRIEGSFTGINTIELLQADARLTNIFFERNANGTGGQAPNQRFGRGGNDPGVVFVRSSQPVIANNTFINNVDLDSPVISINANALTADQIVDTGRQRILSREAVNTSNGLTVDNDRVPNHLDNQGPLIVGNILENNTYNGMQVRGATLTTESVWDDTDIVHILLNEQVIVPDLHTYGGLRLESKVNESLVVKSQGANSGLLATGRPLEIEDRVGGRIHVIGQPGFPVIMTSITDDTASAGNRTDGRPQGDTNNNNQPLVLTPGLENAATGLEIDNDLATTQNGYLTFNAGFGGMANPGSDAKVAAFGALRQMINSSLNYVRVGTGATATITALQNTTQVQAATRDVNGDDIVVSKGTFPGDNGQTISWTVTSRILPGKLSIVNTLDFTSSTGVLGALQVINEVDINASAGGAADLLLVTGDPAQGQSTFRLTTLSNAGRFGFAQGGVYNPSSALVNATWNGYAANTPANLNAAITGPTPTFAKDNTTIGGLASIVDPSLGSVWGPGDVSSAMSWTVSPTSNSAKVTTFLDLIPVNPVNAGVAGEWRGIILDENSHDRNIGVIVEGESDLPGDSFERNGTPSRSQFLGYLASSAKAGDETLRLGYTINGVLRSNDDVDIYTFYAEAGTEVWIDIDRTTHALDTVVELVDENGTKIFLSNNSEIEAVGGQIRYEDPSYAGKSLKMQKTPPFDGQDFYTTNPRDAGMRVVLYGPPGQHLYHLRVRSSNPNVNAAPGSVIANSANDGTRRGLTKGAYQVELRLQEVDEFAGSTIQYADLRNAINGIEVIGLPRRSPLVGEGGEVANETVENNTRGTATYLGNVFNSDRGTISFAGVLGGLNNSQNRVDVDWYSFDTNFDAIQQPAAAVFPFEIDVDYADGLGRPDVELYLYNAAGVLLAASRDSNVSDDRAAPDSSSNIADLTRGTVGASDALLGPIGLPTGQRYFLAVASAYATANAMNNNITMRMEPVNSTLRIVEDHIEDYIFTPLDPGTTTIEQPKIENLFNNDGSSEIPFRLGDVSLFVAQENNNPGVREGAILYQVDPFTGATETQVGGINFDIGDIAFRPNGQLFTYELDEDASPTDPTDDAESGRFYGINTGVATPTLLGNDAIDTYELDAAGAPVISHLYNGARIGWGLQYYAMAFGDVNDNVPGERLLMVGHRGDQPGLPAAPNVDTTRYIPVRSNILYQANPNNGTHFGDTVTMGSRLLPNEPPPALNYPNGPYTPQYEVGEIPTQPIMTTVDVTRLNGGGLANFILKDGQQFLIDDGSGPVTYEFDAGLEIRNEASIVPDRPDLPGNRIVDGDFFLIDPNTSVDLDETIVQFDSGTSIQVNVQASGTGLTSLAGAYDGQTLSITSMNGNGLTFEFDTNGEVLTPGAISVDLGAGVTPPGGGNGPNIPSANVSTTGVAIALANAINSQAAILQITATPVGNVVSMVGDNGIGASAGLTTNVASTPPAPILSIRGSVGFAPVLKFPAAALIAPGTQLTFTTTFNTTVATPFFFTIDGVGTGIGTPIPLTNGGGGSPVMNGTAVAGQVAAVIAATAPSLLSTKQVGDLLMVNGVGITYAGLITDLTSITPAPTMPDRELVRFEESWPISGPRTNPNVVSTAIRNTINNNTVYVVGADENRLNFPNFTEGSFATLAGGFVGKQIPQSVSVFSVTNWNLNGAALQGLLDPSANRVPFLADDGNFDSPVLLGDRIATAINDNQPTLSAVSQADRVTIVNGSITIPGGVADPTCALVRPVDQLYTCGQGPGGFITGMANLRGDIYAVSSNGGLYQLFPDMTNSEIPPALGSGISNTFVPTQWIANSKDDLFGINFQGLTPGPQTTENGRYRDMLFAIDNDGLMYAISTVNKASTPFNDVGRLQPIFVDGAVYVDTGITDARGLGFSNLEQNLWHITPDLPATGERQAETGHGIRPAFDGSRAADLGRQSYHFSPYNFAGGAHGSMISNEFSLKGYSLADQPMFYFNYFNASGPSDELRVSVSNDGGNWTAAMINGTQNDGNWHQARVSLGGFAGQEHLRVRVDFVSGGDLDVGSPETHGDELYALKGYQIDDGDSFTLADDLAGLTSTTYEFDLGYSLHVGSGASIPTGTTFEVSNGATTVLYRFIRSGAVGATDILIRDSMTPREVAEAIGNRLISTVGLGITPRYNNDSKTTEPNDGTVNLQGATGLVLGNTSLPGLTVTGASSYRFLAHDGRDMVDTETIMIDDGVNAPLTFEFDSTGAFTNGNVPVNFTVNDSLITIASNLRTAIQQQVANGRINVTTALSASGTQLQINGALLVRSITTRAQGQTIVVDGVTNGNTPVRIHRGMSREEVATAMQVAMERQYLHPSMIVPDGSLFADGQSFTISDGTNVPVLFEFDTGYILQIPINGAQPVGVPLIPTNYVAAGDRFTLSNGAPGTVTLTIEFDDGTLPANADPDVFRVMINPLMPQSTVARLVSTLMQTNAALTSRMTALGLDGTAISGGRVQLGGNPTGVFLTAGNIYDPVRAPLATTVFGITGGGAAPGVTTGANRIYLQQYTGFTAAQMAAAIEQAIDSSVLVNRITTVRDPALPHRIDLIANDPAFQQVTVTLSPPPQRPPLSIETKSDIVHRHGSTIFAVGHDVLDEGPLGLEDQLLTDPVLAGEPDPGINNRAADAAHYLRRGQDNNYEGPYIDDFVIGFRERGEMMTYTAGNVSNDTFTIPAIAAAPNLEGPYQVEIRRGPVYGTPNGVLAGTDEEMARTFDTNDRLNSSIQLIGKSGGDVADGQTFTLSDGVNYVTFEFDDLTTANSNAGTRVAQGNLPIAYFPTDTIEQLGNKIRDAINSTDARAALNFAAATADGILQTATSTSHIVNLHGPATLKVAGAPVLEPNDLRDQAVVVDLNASDRPVYFVDGAIGDRADLANAIDPFSGLYSGGRDVDLFQVQLQAGSTIHIDIDAALLDSTLDAYLRVFRRETNGTLTQLAASSNASAPGETAAAGLLDPYLEFIATTAGTYFIGVSSQGNGGYIPTTSITDGSYVNGLTTGKYQLEISGSLDPLVFRPLLPSSIEFVHFDDTFGDDNLSREQGQLIISNNTISRMSNWGILVDAAVRNAADGNSPHPGTVRQISQINDDRLVPGVVIENNVIHNNNTGAILFSGDNSAVGPLGAVPFGRIVNNTLFGKGGTFAGTNVVTPFADVGIRVEQNASPTLMNNILSNFRTGITVDASSQALGTVVAANVYKQNTTNSTPASNGDQDIFLLATDPLFIKPAAGNFYLQANSSAIDSGVKSLLDRADMTRLRDPLEISPAPIVVSEYDIQGLQRVDDFSVSTPAGVGDNKYVDRGAVERADFAGPSGGLILPLDNGVDDQDSGDHRVGLPASSSVREIVIQLIDQDATTGNNTGAGIDDTTVTSDLVIVRDLNNGNRLLVDGIDYTFFYDATSNEIHLTPIGVQFPQPATYEIELDINNGLATDLTPAIRDRAGNLLQANGVEGGTNVHKYLISIGTSADYGDAPNTPIGNFPADYPVLRGENGASHELIAGFFLGNGVTVESDGSPTAAANGDSNDDGVSNINFVANGASVFTVSASQPGVLDAWLDLNNNGTWDEATEHIVSQAVVAGSNIINVPADKMQAAGGQTYARFRLTTNGLATDGSPLQATGPASNGEVEDYLVNVIAPPFRNPDTIQWSNRIFGFDVDNNKIIEPLDALWIISLFIRRDNYSIPLVEPNLSGFNPVIVTPTNLSTDKYYDVNGDNVVDVASDLIPLISFLNSPEYRIYLNNLPPAPEGEAAEGESAAEESIVVAAAPPVVNPVPETIYAASNVVVDVVTESQAVEAAVFGEPATTAADPAVLAAFALTEDDDVCQLQDEETTTFAAVPLTSEDDDLLDLLASDIEESFGDRND